MAAASRMVVVMRAAILINNWEAIKRAIWLQVMAKFQPQKFNLAVDYIPQDDGEKFAMYLLHKYHGDEQGKRKWQK